MTDEEALTILGERRGTMYDPLVVDVFAASYKRIMPSEEAAAHPAAKAVGGARETAPAPPADLQETDAAPGPDSAINEVLMISSLARAVSGDASLSAEAALDLGLSGPSLDPPLRSSLTVPLSHDGRVVGVLSCYSPTAQGFTEDHQRLLELMAASLASAIAAVANAEGAAPQLSANASRRVSGSTVLSIVR